MCTPISLYTDTGRHMVISTNCIHFLSCSMLVHYLSAALLTCIPFQVPVFLIEGLSIACRVSVLLEWANIIRPAMFDLESEWTVGVGGQGKSKKTPPPPEEAVRMLYTPWLVAIIFAKKILSTCSPKLHQLCRLGY